MNSWTGDAASCPYCEHQGSKDICPYSPAYRHFYLKVAILCSVCCFGPSFGYASTTNASSFIQEDAFHKGLSALKENRLEEALEALTAAEQERPEDARVRNFRGITLAQLGKTAEAAAEYREAIRLDPKYEVAYRNLGFLLWTQQQLDQAREVLGHAVAVSSDDAFAHYYLGRVHLDARQYPDAFRELKLSGIPWPADAGFLIQVATGYEAVGDHQEARKILDQLSTLPLSDTQIAQVASLLLAINEFEKAITILKKASSRPPTNSVSWAPFDLGLAYLLSGDYEKALKQAQSCLDFMRTQNLPPAVMGPAYSLIGITHARLGGGDLAVQALRRAATLDPGQEEGWMNLSRELMELSRYPEAISAVHEGIAANPKSYALHLRLGAAHLAAGHYKEAEDAFRTLVEAGDPRPTSYVGLAQVLLREGRPKDAVTMLSAAKQKIGENFLLSYFLGLSLDRSAKRLEAIAAFQEAVGLDPKNAEAHLGLGKVELALGHLNDAIAELEEALRLSPGNLQARRLLSQAYRRAGDPARAAKYAEATEGKSPAPEGDLLGDFLLPPWQTPADN
jgi:tetratricopeptide (TPR) repeat protein